MTATELEILKDALHCLTTYQTLCEVHPYGRHGHPIHQVLINLRDLIVKHTSIGHEIPALREVTRLAHKLDKKAWED